MRELAARIRKTGERRWEIPRETLNKVLGKTTLIARAARIAPHVKNGKPAGFKLLRVGRGRFYDVLGLRRGDVINAINGHALTTPSKALEIYTKLRRASHISLSFTRRGKTVTHEYVIR
jgi:general secretion pathway protein C